LRVVFCPETRSPTPVIVNESAAGEDYTARMRANAARGGTPAKTPQPSS
jgi:hypothetical protein